MEWNSIRPGGLALWNDDQNTHKTAGAGMSDMKMTSLLVLHNYIKLKMKI